MAGRKKSLTRKLFIGLSGAAVATGMLGLGLSAGKRVQVPSYRAIRVIDGDTFETAEKQRIRVSGIDAPELDQCGGEEAKKELEKLIMGKDLYLKVVFLESSRLVALVYTKDGSMATKMIRSGRAEPHDRENLDLPEYKEASQVAHEKRLGLHGPPCTQKTNPDNTECNIKGNVNGDERIYHLTSCLSYKNALVQLHHGDEWFCTEAEAKKAGFRKAGQCD